MKKFLDNKIIQALHKINSKFFKSTKSHFVDLSKDLKLCRVVIRKVKKLKLQMNKMKGAITRAIYQCR
jgi:hypothetical protein